MTHEEILTRAILKAEKNGYRHDYLLCDHGVFDGGRGQYGAHMAKLEERGLILSPSFAKAFWGEDDEPSGLCVWDEADGVYRKHWLAAWQYHLQQMVLEEEPLEYLEKFL